jgi:hypothetical protein
MHNARATSDILTEHLEAASAIVLSSPRASLKKPIAELPHWLACQSDEIELVNTLANPFPPVTPFASFL